MQSTIWFESLTDLWCSLGLPLRPRKVKELVGLRQFSSMELCSSKGSTILVVYLCEFVRVLAVFGDRRHHLSIVAGSGAPRATSHSPTRLANCDTVETQSTIHAKQLSRIPLRVAGLIHSILSTAIFQASRWHHQDY